MYYLPDIDYGVPENQLVSTRKTGCFVHPGDSSWQCAPNVFVLAKNTAFKRCWPPRLSHKPRPTLSSYPKIGYTTDKTSSHLRNHNFRTKTAQTLPKIWPSRNSWQNSAPQFFKKVQGFFPEFNPKVEATYIPQRHNNLAAGKKFFQHARCVSTTPRPDARNRIHLTDWKWNCVRLKHAVW